MLRKVSKSDAKQEMSAGVETTYTIFQTIAGDNLKNLIQRIPEPRILSFSQKNFSFIRRAIPSSVLNDLLQLFQKTLFFDDIQSGEDPGLTGSFCAMSIDDQDEVKEVCETLKGIPKCKKYIILIPRVTTGCQEIIIRSGVDAEVLELPLEIIPLEEKLFIVPSPRCFERCFISEDLNDVYTVAKSLLRLQLFTSGVGRTFYAGEMSTRVFTLLEQMKNQCGYSQFQHPQFDDFFIIDRTVDLITPLASQFYYGGLLDDNYEVEFGFLHLPTDIEVPDHPEIKEVLLSGLTDTNYKTIGGMSLVEAQNQIQEIRRSTKKLFEDIRESIGTVQWGPMAKKAEKLIQEQPYLTMHSSLIAKILSEKNFKEDIYNYEYGVLLHNPHDLSIIEQLIEGGRLIEALRLLCFTSLVSSDTILTKTIEDFHRKIINQAGFESTKELIGLEKCGLFDNPSGFLSFIGIGHGPSFSDMNRVLNLVVSQNDSELITDIHNGYDGFVPIIHRFVQSGLRGGWKQGEPVEKLLSRLKIPHSVVGDPEPQPDYLDKPRKVLVFIIGGVTSTEISLFSEMGTKLFRGRYDFHVGSTNITNGKKLIKSICPSISDKSK